MKEILRYKNILISIIIVVVFIFVIKGLWGKYTITIANLKVKMSDLEKGRITIDEWNGVSGEYDNLAKIFFAKDESLFKKFVEEKTKSSGINVDYLSPSRRKADFYTDVSISLRASFDAYSNILNFVRELEAKKIIVEALRIRSRDKVRSADMAVKSFILEEQ